MSVLSQVNTTDLLVVKFHNASTRLFEHRLRNLVRFHLPRSPEKDKVNRCGVFSATGPAPYVQVLVNLGWPMWYASVLVMQRK